MVFLDSQTKDTDYRITSFGDEIEDVVADFLAWTSEHGLTNKDIWYADIFEPENKNRHLAQIVLDDEGGCIIAPPSAVVVNPFKRRKQ